MKALVVGGLLSLFALRAEAAQIQVAVAANFTEPAKEIATLFKHKTGNDLLLSFGASGVFYSQITHGAPFEILLSADQERPKHGGRKRFCRRRQPLHLRHRQAGAVEQGRST